MDVGPGLEGRTVHISSPFIRASRKILRLIEFSIAAIKVWLKSRPEEKNQFSISPFSEADKFLW